MKGFIEVTEVGSGNAILINVGFICTVLQCNNKSTIYTVKEPWSLKESYEEIVNKIKRAMDD